MKLHWYVERYTVEVNETEKDLNIYEEYEKK